MTFQTHPHLCASLILAVALFACKDSDPGPGHSKTAVTIQNGLVFNKLNPNGIQLNGIQLNGIGLNGIQLNGIGLNGIQLNGIGLNGIRLNGIQLNGIGLNGIQLNGIGLNGIQLNGIQLNGIQLNGIQLNGIQLNGIQLNGIRLNGIQLNGIQLNGIQLNGIGLNGIQLNGIGLNGIRLNGIQLNGIQLNGIQLNGIQLNSAQLADFKSLLQNMAECALSPGQYITITDIDGSDYQIEGQNGLDPSWATNMLSSEGAEAAIAQCMQTKNPAITHENVEARATERMYSYAIACALPSDRCVSLTRADGSTAQYCGAEGLDPGWETGAASEGQVSENVAQCVMARAEAAGDQVTDTHAEFRTIVAYAVQCALPEGAHITMTDFDGSSTVDLYGAIGLAPWWETGPLAPAPDPLSADAGERRVSACLAARSNGRGTRVRVSLRSDEINASQIEQVFYPHHEGAFWGNLFSSDPYIKTCEVAGEGLSGRVCTTAACGFTSRGACAQAGCTQNADGTYSGCDGEPEQINTFLNVGDDFQVSGDDLWTVRPDGHAVVSQTDHQSCTFHSETGVAYISGSCVRKQDGSAWCDGQRMTALGYDVATIASTVQGTSCAVKTDGTLWCWGKNTDGQLGLGYVGGTVAEPTQVTALPGAVERVFTGLHTLALLEDGTIWAWGNNYNGQLGIGVTETVGVATPTQIWLDIEGNRFEGVTDLASSMYFQCGRKLDGSVWCWGNLGVGDGTRSMTLRPSRVVSLGTTEGSKVIPGGLRCGVWNQCAALTADGTVMTWGGDVGGFGRAQVVRNAIKPMVVPNLPPLVDLKNGLCGMAADLSIHCWEDWGLRNDDYTIAMTRCSPGDPGAYMPSCGDGLCDMGPESYGSTQWDAVYCPQDCPAPPESCGDGLCTLAEQGNCDADCGYQANCGDGFCNTINEVGSSYCAQDCGPKRTADGICECTEPSPSWDCEKSSGSPSKQFICGNGTREAAETARSCPADFGLCGATPICGDGRCEGPETSSNCPADCDATPPPVCGDGTCDSSEDCSSCEADCGACSTCSPRNSQCSADGDCCSGNCKNNGRCG